MPMTTNRAPKLKPKIQSEDLPKISKKTVGEIKVLHDYLSQNKDHLEPQDAMLFEKIYLQRMPEVIDNYKSIDAKRAIDISTTTTKGTPDELLQQALASIKDIMIEFKGKAERQKIKDLDFSNKLTKNFIKKTF